ncbi:MAG TPA: site-specific integrase, partial [Pyrodictiaceae archaeon]|nr:site-specific integrase [Pyrodictiaceae archaeon]
KEGDWKTLPMPSIIEERLLERAKEKKSPFVFCHCKGTQGKFWYHYGDKQLRKIFKQACEAVGIYGITLYQAVRHSLAMQALNEGHSYEVVARTLGHKHLATTRRYGKLKAESVRSLLEDRAARIISLEEYREKRRETGG